MLLESFVVAVSLGIFAQVIAERLHLPAILPLLASGVIAGPAMLGLIHPESMGHGLEVLVHLGVAVILFEGGLSLDLGQLSRVGASVRNLLTIGALVSGVGAAALAHWLTGMSWPTAALFGSIMTVTGPTVIAPLMRHMIAPRRVKTILVSEGLMIDPIGAVLAYLVLQAIARADLGAAALVKELVQVAFIGSVLGFAAGAAARSISRVRWISGELRNLAILALLLVLYLVSDEYAPQSGILAAVVMGLTLSGSRVPDLVSMKTFKEQLTTFLISLLFVLLSAKLDLDAVRQLGWRGVAVAVGLVFLVRPLSVAASVWPGHLPLAQRVALGLTAPRGIVAAAVASLSAISLREAGLDGAAELEGLVYVSILVTCVLATVGALVLPRLLGFLDDPSRRRSVLVGANALTAELARVLRRRGEQVVVVDSAAFRLDELRREGFTALVGDARDVATYEEAGVERDTFVVAATTNDALNLLAAELVHTELGVHHPVVALQRPPDDFGTRSRAWAELLGGKGFDLPRWLRELEDGSAEVWDLALRDDTAREKLADALKRWPELIAVLCGWKNGRPEFRPLSSGRADDIVTVVIAAGEVRSSLAGLRRASAEPEGAGHDADA